MAGIVVLVLDAARGQSTTAAKETTKDTPDEARQALNNDIHGSRGQETASGLPANSLSQRLTVTQTYEGERAGPDAIMDENTQSGRTDNVLGIDDRVPLNNMNSFPYRTVGVVSGNGGYRGTGVLVYKNLVLTAAHCVMDQKTKKIATDVTYFECAVANKRIRDKSRIEWIWWGTSTPDTDRENDWAILRIADDLGTKYGWLGTTDKIPRQAILVGYSQDYNNGGTATTAIARFRKRQGGLLLHDGACTRGSSGGPLIAKDSEGKIKVVALGVAEYRQGGENSLKLAKYSDDVANIAVPASRFIQPLIAIIAGKTWPPKE
jgi:protease YdgD